MDLSFPPLTLSDSLDATTRIIPIAKHISKLSLAEAKSQADFFHALLANVICQQLLPSATYNLFTFSLRFSPSAQNISSYSIIGIQATATPPPYHACHKSFRDFLHHELPQSTLTALHCQQPDYERLLAYVIILADLFSGRKDISATNVTTHGFPFTSSLCQTTEADINITLKLKPYTAVPDLLADLASDGLDLTSLQPYL